MVSGRWLRGMLPGLDAAASGCALGLDATASVKWRRVRLLSGLDAAASGCFR